MSIKTIPLSRLEEDPEGTLLQCADGGQAIVVELPDHRLVAIHSLEPSDDDSLVDNLLASNDAFRKMVAESKASPRVPFPPRDSK
jgi:hypothetical protein